MSSLVSGGRGVAEVFAERERAPTASAACAILDQCGGFLARISNDTYTRPSSRLFGSTVGQHVRHALDHFEAACAGLEGRTIVYDRRERGTSIETSREAALEHVSSLSRRIGVVGVAAAALPVRIEVMLSAGGDETVLESTLGRELAFAAHHAIHHHAMMASLGEEFGVTPPAGFGKAPATIHHEGSKVDG